VVECLKNVPHDAAMKTIVPPTLAANRLVPPILANRFAAAGQMFELEHAGQFIRIWCVACDKFEHLPDDQRGTVATARSVHRCGGRASAWACGDFEVRA
jgi:hypothetical protein